jgi:hypothetical protein
MTAAEISLKDTKNLTVKAESSSKPNISAPANDQNKRKRIAAEEVEDQGQKEKKKPNNKSSLSRKINWDYGSDKPFHLKKYTIENGVEVVQKEPYTVIDFFAEKWAHEKKVNTAENDEARERCLEDMLNFHWQFEYFRASSSYTRPKSLFAIKGESITKYRVFRKYE